MKLIIILTLFVGFSNIIPAQTKIYNPDANAKKELADAIQRAGEKQKHVLIQIGGNWCPWCIKFHKFVGAHAKIDSLIKNDYVFLLLNYSKEKIENRNLDIMKQLNFPQRFGFPVLVVLDGSGKVLHIQDSGYLESGNDYDEKKVMTFLKNWSLGALNPELYKEK
ncbi:MAG: hypothetical protein A2275_16330 [Bacteroidetes bacterium RIFOXYA12_FULL_35_11]|nr:MAG: hypothetical protein A2X01_20995 [Bacteroidetes bacterium GWF2_35_48]OFY75427.1 MAG: hypothetical protein A2275_16330 [Bacteroidetes bacterium RIFOXYA12_FULL_35_11]OFY97547.1 MAG: hypothetical protein A2309_06670 [Bacteroidetes bacterium RIFOXYB2_FULL_35_7]